MDVDVDNDLVEGFRKLNEDDADFAKKCNALANDIRTGSYTILQLVEQLKALLIDTVPNNRQLGMIILCRVIELLPDDLLTSIQLNFVCVFYSDRLNDHHQVIPAVLRGILALLKFKNLPEGVAKQILGSLFKNVPCQQQQQADRYNIYKIIQISLDTKHTELVEMEFDFIYGVISAMDGERDPRNLLHLFQWLPKFLKNFKLGHLTEEMFEVLACYFPVDFKAPSQDPNSVSRESLAEALCICLCSVSEFAELCLPLALEKLSSSLQIAKLDSLNILAEGCKTFPTPFYVQHATDIWTQIVREINSNDPELRQLALTVLEKFVNKISQSDSNVFEQVFDDNLKNLQTNLVPHAKSFDTSSKVILHFAKGSNQAAHYTLKHFFPLFVNVYNMTKTPSHKSTVLRVLTNLVKTCSDACSKENVGLICTFSLEAVVQSDEVLRTTGFEALSQMTSVIPTNLRMALYDNFRCFLITPFPRATRNAFLNCLKAVAQAHSEEVKMQVLNGVEITVASLEIYLDALTRIVDLKDFVEVVLNIFLNYCTKSVAEATISTAALKHLLNVYETNDKILKFLLEKDVINLLINVAVPYLGDDNAKPLITNISSICNALIEQQNPTSQFQIVNNKLIELITLYRNNRNLVAVIILIGGLVTRINREVSLECEIFDDVLIILQSDQEDLQQAAILLVANILNKAPETKLENYLKKVADLLESHDVPKLRFYVTKALVMRGHSQATPWTEKLLDLLATDVSYVRSFQIIMQETCETLNEKCCCNIKLLYRQKFFIEISNKLIEKCKTNNPNFLLAFGYLVQETPIQVLTLQFNNLLHLVVLTLNDCNDVDILCTILDMLSVLIQNKESKFEDLFQEFLPRFLSLGRTHESMKVRIKALECLKHCGEGYQPYKLLPHKQDVVIGLTQCLDDRKRLVRKQAVEARLRWFMLDSPI